MKTEKYEREVDTQNIHIVHSFPRGHKFYSESLRFLNKKDKQPYDSGPTK